MISGGVYGVTSAGALIRADLATKKARLVRRLPGEPELIASAAR